MRRLPLLLLLFQSLALLAIAQPERVAGRVVSAKDGRPLRHAAVSLRDNKNQTDAATVFSDETGRYRFEPLPAGKYNLSARAAGYLQASYLEHGQFSTAIVTGAGLPTGDLRLELLPAASISGRIVDEASEPVHHANVTLYRQDPDNPAQPVSRMRNSQTEADGNYEFTGLPLGHYFVAATATPWYAVHPPPENGSQGMPYRARVDPALDVAYPMVFYPNALTADGAAAIAIQGGEEITANLQLTPRQALTLTLPQGNDERNRRFPQLTRSVFGLQEQVSVQTDYADGSPRLTGLPPGQYVVQEFIQGAGLRGRLGTVDLTSGSTTINVGPAPLGSVAINLRSGDGTPLAPKLQVTLRTTEANERTNATVDEKGLATFNQVPAGEYRIVVNGDGRNLSVTSINVGGKLVPGLRLRVMDGSNLTADVVLAGAPVRVDGFSRRKGQPAAGAMIVLVPAGEDISADLFRRDQADLDGSFAFNNVSPGNYLAVAIDDGWPLRWNDAKTLLPYLLHGIPVTISGKAASPIKLTEAVEAQTR